MFPCMVSGIYWQASLIYRHRIIAEGALCWSTKYGDPRTRAKCDRNSLRQKSLQYNADYRHAS